MKTKGINKIIIIVLSFIFLVSLVSCNSNTTSNSDLSPYENTDFAMGTVVKQTIYSHNASEKNASEIIGLLKKIENNYVSWRIKTSEVAKINENASYNKQTKISNKMKDYLEAALSVSKKSDGSFDPTVGKLSRLWAIDEGKKNIPNEEKINNLTKDVGYQHIKIKGNYVKIPSTINLDFGAIGKGIGCDEVEQYLKNKENIESALINIGGSSILTFRDKPSGEPWRVAIENPRNKENYLGTLVLNGTNHISTSGDYEKYFEKNGTRYHHILNPHTGYPANSGLISTTIVSNNGALSEALSTACFVLGKEKSIDLLKKYKVEAIFVSSDKTIYVTDGLKNKFQLSAQEYKVI